MTTGGWTMRIRSATGEDAKQLLKVIADAENSGFMMYEPGERVITEKQLTSRIEAMAQDPLSAILVAEADGELAGYLFVIVNERPHCAYLAIGIRESSRGQGVGKRLFESLDVLAAERKFHRLELTVMVHNNAGIALYQKKGFKIEGIKKNSLKVDGEYIDEYYMAKLIE